jgi:hypothetical protein
MLGGFPDNFAAYYFQLAYLPVENSRPFINSSFSAIAPSGPAPPPPPPPSSIAYYRNRRASLCRYCEECSDGTKQPVVWQDFQIRINIKVKYPIKRIRPNQVTNILLRKARTKGKTTEFLRKNWIDFDLLNHIH